MTSRQPFIEHFYMK